MQNMSREELLSLLDNIRDQVARGDSREGQLKYHLGTDAERPFQVAAIYRVDGALSNGRTAMVGLDAPAPLACPCSNTSGPFDVHTGLCEDCTETAA